MGVLLGVGGDLVEEGGVRGGVLCRIEGGVDGRMEFSKVWQTVVKV